MQRHSRILAIAKEAWALYRNEETTASVLPFEKARRLLEKHRKTRRSRSIRRPI